MLIAVALFDSQGIVVECATAIFFRTVDYVHVYFGELLS